MRYEKKTPAKKKPELPDVIYVYVCDHENGEPILAATADINEIPTGEKFREYNGGATGHITRGVLWD